MHKLMIGQPVTKLSSKFCSDQYADFIDNIRNIGFDIFFRSVEKYVLELTQTKRQLTRKPSGEEHSDQSPPTKDVEESEKTGVDSDGKNEPKSVSIDGNGTLEKPVENPTGDDKETKPRIDEKSAPLEEKETIENSRHPLKFVKDPSTGLSFLLIQSCIFCTFVVCYFIGNTPVMYAAMENKIGIIERLLELGCDLGASNREGIKD